MNNIKIADTKKISDLQKEFNALFPFLKLEFFVHKHKVQQGSFKKDMLNTELTLQSFRKKHTEGTIFIKESMKVSEIEDTFQRVFGLSVQVFRKSGRSWIE
ncbi:MAG TPA: hypothetical protein VNY73_02655, partial [Bacteroidia bacterium]|nr:hypothetical protein [Bacteroidia bacterium]